MTIDTKDAAAIVGIGESRYARSLEESEAALGAHVVLAACDDAGIDPSEIDGMCSYTIESVHDTAMSLMVGTGDLTFFANVNYGGGAGPGCVGLLANAIATGQCTVGIAWRSRKRGSGGRPWVKGAAAANPHVAVGGEFTRPAGFLRPVDEVAVLARRYLEQFGVTREQLAHVALILREYANANPRAAMYERQLTMDQYLEARWISEPLCLFDACLESDGAAAVLLVSAERAKDLAKSPVYVHASAQGMPTRTVSQTNYFGDDPLRAPGSVCATSLFSRSDIKAEDLDVAQFYDAFSPLVLWALEAYGIVAPGEAAAFVADGGIALEGALPVNTSGGSLSEAYVHGFNLIIEGVRQLRGESTSQVAGAETCLVTGSETVPTSAMILRR